MNHPNFNYSKTHRIALWVALVWIWFNAQSVRGDSVQFAVIPSAGTVSGNPGSTVGWGYSITNLSTADWLVTTDIAADSFLHATPTLLFDFPSLAPGQTVTEAFNANTFTGLYQLAWDNNAPPAFNNSGHFVISAQWWDGDPAGNGNFIADAVDVGVAYSATVNAYVAVPEPPSSLLFLATAVLSMWPVWRPSRS